MSISRRFRDLERELRRLKKQFIPKISPTGTYSDRQLSLTIAYRVLAHAEIEAYLEERAWDVALHAKKNWDNKGSASRTLISLVAFSGQTMELPPNTLTPVKASKQVPANKIKIDEKIKSALTAFQQVIQQNHGLKESNILSLLLPIGVNSDDLDSVFLANMDTFGKDRGVVAHSSAQSHRVTNLSDPATELNRIKQIIGDLVKLDELISNLMK